MVIPYHHNDLWGLVERGMNSGILTPRYTYMRPLGNGYFDVSYRDSNVVIIDSIGKETISLPHNKIDFTGSGLFRYTGKNGETAWYHVSGRRLNFGKDVAQAISCSENRLAYKDVNGREGFLDVYGNPVIRAVYDQVLGFYRGYAAVRNGTKYGAIDSQGNVIIPVEHDSVKILGNDRFAVYKNKNARLVNSSHQPLNNFGYDWVGDFNEGLLPVKNGADYWYVNLAGETESPKRYIDAHGFDNGTAIVMTGEASMIINTKQEILYKAPPHYEIWRSQAGTFFEVFDKSTGKFLVTDKHGKELFTGMHLVNHTGNRSYITVEKDGKLGLINETGILRLQPIYKSLIYVKELDLWSAVKDEGYGYIDEQGLEYWVKN